MQDDSGRQIRWRKIHVKCDMWYVSQRIRVIIDDIFEKENKN